MSFRPWRWVALAGCVALAALAMNPHEAAARRGRGGSSLFVNTPYGIVPKSVMYGQYMSPAQFQAQQAAEQKAIKKAQTAYMKRNGITPPKTTSTQSKPKKKT